LSLTVVSCGGGGGDEQTADPSQSAAAEPDENGIVEFVQGGTTGYALDPHKHTQGQTGFGTFTALYDRLLQLSGDSRELEPMLAESWEWDSSNTQLTMSLRDDVKFHDGSAFNAEVAVQNLRRIAEPDSAGSQLLRNMTNDATIRLTFSSPNPAVLYGLANLPGMMVSPAGMADPDSLKNADAGSGAFEFASVDSSITYRMTRFEDYWDTERVYPSEMVILNIPDENARINAVKTGVADGTYITAQSYARASGDASLQVDEYQSLSPFVVYINNTIPPFDDGEVRRALSLALDREEFDASQNGLCPPLGQVFPEGMPGHVDDDSLEPRTDVEEAKELIEEAGAAGATVKVVQFDIEPYVTLTNIVQRQLNDVGFNVELTRVSGQLGRPTFQEGGHAIMVAPTSATYPDPMTYLERDVLGIGNPGEQDPELVGMIEEAAVLPLESDERTVAFEEINKYMVENPVWVPMCQQTNLFAGTSQLVGLDEMPYAAMSQAPDSHYLQVTSGAG
jgi:peptide/nickel transport system substrate-binding protein